MKFHPEMILLIVLLFFFLSGCAERLIKNDGNLNLNIFKSKKDTKKKENESQILSGPNGELYQEVPKGVSTRTIEDRMDSTKNGIGWDSTALLPKDESGFDTMSPIEFAKGENFLEPQKLMGSIVDSNRNANLQLRRDPYIPAKTVSPFLQSTMGPDENRKGIEM